MESAWNIIIRCRLDLAVQLNSEKRRNKFMKKALVTCGIYLYSIPLKKILVCHATNSPWNKWSIPKGLQDEGEELYAAAARELYEETGVSLKELHLVNALQLPAVKYQKQNKLLESFLVLTDADL